MMLWTAVFLTFCLVLVMFLLVFYAATYRQRSIAQRILTQTTSPEENVRRKKEPFSLKTMFKKASRIFVSRGIAVKAEADMIRAGIPLTGEEGLMLWLVMLIGVPALSLIVFQDVQTALLMMALVGAAPFFMLRFVSARRIQQFEGQIGSALVIMANSMRAGFSFMQALETVGREMTDPIASEFRRVLREMNLGIPTEQALINMGERVGSKDLDLVVTAILIQRQVGGNLAEVLTNISGTIRGRIQLARELRVLTAQGKISGMIIGLLPFFLGILLFIINRDYILTLFTDSRGLMLLGAGVVSQVIGLLLVRKIVDIKM